MLSPGTKLGPYEVVGALGAGGMGEVEPVGRRPSCPAKIPSAARDRMLSPGTNVDPYEVVGALGAGAWEKSIAREIPG